MARWAYGEHVGGHPDAHSISRPPWESIPEHWQPAPLGALSALAEAVTELIGVQGRMGATGLRYLLGEPWVIVRVDSIVMRCWIATLERNRTSLDCARWYRASEVV